LADKNRDDCRQANRSGRGRDGNLAIEAASYYRARYYDPTAGRFISEDPMYDKEHVATMRQEFVVGVCCYVGAG
jgi:RHS repeat-associated protein